MSDWIMFRGGILPGGDRFRLIAEGGNGEIEFVAENVRFENGRLMVRNGARALRIDQPADTDVSQRPTPDQVAALCPTGITICIGGLLVCAADFKVIGTCAGAWGSTRQFQPD
jgi:hypothetical protein